MRKTIVSAALAASVCCMAEVAAQPESAAYQAIAGMSFAPYTGAVTNLHSVGKKGSNYNYVTFDYVIHAEEGSEILCRMSMPPPDRWDGRLWGHGHGGYAGNVRDLSAPKGAARVTCDLGTGRVTGHRTHWPTAMNEAEWKDFGWRSTHLMTVFAKRFCEAYYGKLPHHSYFTGGSTGGGQALHEATRFPEDYDGVIASVPAQGRVALEASLFHRHLTLMENGRAVLSTNQLQIVADAAIEFMKDRDEAYCAGKYLSDPRECEPFEKEILDLAAKKDPVFANPDIRRRLHEIYAGPVVDGRRIHHGFPFGARITYTPGNFCFSTHLLCTKGAPEPKDATWKDFIAFSDARSKDIDAMDPDLRRFAARGGKILSFVGFEDQTVPFSASLQHWEDVAALFGSVDAVRGFYRMYFLPGAAHGGIGRATRSLLGYGGDMNERMIDWVEKGIPPEDLDMKTHFGDTIKVAPYPEKAYRDADGTWKRKPALRTVRRMDGPGGREQPAVAGAEVRKFVTGKVLPWGGPQVGSAGFALRELDALDVKCDEAWCALKSRAEYDAYRKELKVKMLAALGTMPERAALNARTVAKYAKDGYSIEKVVFESMPGVFVTANLYVPDGGGKRPAIVMSCGHAMEEGKDYPVYSRACVIAAKQGFVALMFDPHCQGERRAILHASRAHTHTQIGLRASLIDWSAPLLRIWDGIRAIDYVVSRAEVDAARIGYMGQSGGGTMTALMEAVDDRIKAAAPSCYLTSLRALCATMGPQDGEQNIYGQLGFGLNHTGYVLIPDIPVAVTCKFSDAFPYTGVQALWKTVRTLERNVGIGERAMLNCSPGPHGWTEANETASVLYIARHLMPGRRDAAIDLPALWQLDLGFDIGKVDIGLAESERRCTAEGTTEALPGWRSILDVIAERARNVRAAGRPLDAAAKCAVAAKLAKVKMPSDVLYAAKETFSGEIGGLKVAKLAVQYTATGHMLPAVFIGGKGKDRAPVLVAAWGGRGNGLKLAQGYLDEGHPVMLADVSGVGELARELHIYSGAKDRPDEGLGAMCYLMGEPLAGRRATDLLVLSDVLSARCGGKRPMLVASGSLSIAAAHAYAACKPAWAGVELFQKPEPWKVAVEGGLASAELLRYADIVPGAYMSYDWVDLLGL